MKKVEVKFMRFEHRYGRMIALAQLQDEAGNLAFGDAPLATLLVHIAQNNWELTNAHKVLHTLVVEGGYAS